VVLSATLDTSCAQNWLSTDETPDDALVELVAAALAGRLSVRVSEEALAEVARTPDEQLRERRLARLKAFGPLKLPAHRVGARENIAQDLHAALFPKATPGSRGDEHNWRDCRQLATHRLIGRDVFVTRDQGLLKRAEQARAEGIEVASSSAVLDRLEDEAREAGVVSYPSISVRDADPERDEAAVREVLVPLADDYPDFGAWLTGRLQDRERTRIRVGEFEGRVGAVALSGRKDARVLKLSAFYVADFARASGLGGHLLWSELRTWVRQGLEKVYVTVSSRHADLIAFFTGFGFLVEGISPRRYQDDTAEFVLAKHLVRERVEDGDLEEFARRYAEVVFWVPPRADVPPTRWGLRPDAARPQLRWDLSDGSATLIACDGDTELRRWDLLDLERIFYPTRFALAGRQALLIPIQKQWADALVEYAHQQRSLSGGAASEKLLLRADNAYYCYPKSLPAAQPGAPILLYVNQPVGAVIGEARIFAAELDEPEELYLRYGGLGIYELSQIRSHVIKRGPRAGYALALRFGMYVPFTQPVSRSNMFEAMGRTLSGPQGVTPISFEEFEAVRRNGGIKW
jgi:hypothetical protein